MTGRDDIHEDDFPNHVKEMHQDRDKKIEIEYKVRISTYTHKVSIIHFMQSLDKLPQPASDIATLPCNQAQNRFRNIYPCK